MVLNGTGMIKCKAGTFSKRRGENKAVWFRDTVTKLAAFHRTSMRNKTLDGKKRQASARLTAIVTYKNTCQVTAYGTETREPESTFATYGFR